MSKPEQIIIDDLIVLGRAVPAEIKNGRRTICTAGYSPTHGFIRIFPTRWDSPLKRWNIIKVPVERPRKPRYDGRSESWKIVGSRRDWNWLSEKIEVVGKFPRKDQTKFIEGLVDNCVNDIYDSGRSLGIIRPTILDYYFEEQEDFKGFVQKTLDGRFRIQVKDEYPLEPRIKYNCPVCRVKRGFHDQQVLEWGIYEWVRKNPDNMEQVWENLGLLDPEYEKFFLVGNLMQYPTAFVVISVLRFKKSITITDQLRLNESFFNLRAKVNIFHENLFKEKISNIAINYISEWKDINNVLIESIRKINLEDNEYSFWHVRGKYDWTEGRTGYFSIMISENKRILGFTSTVGKVHPGEIIPSLKNYALDNISKMTPDTREFISKRLEKIIEKKIDKKEE